MYREVVYWYSPSQNLTRFSSSSWYQNHWYEVW